MESNSVRSSPKAWRELLLMWPGQYLSFQPFPFWATQIPPLPIACVAKIGQVDFEMLRDGQPVPVVTPLNWRLNFELATSTHFSARSLWTEGVDGPPVGKMSFLHKEPRGTSDNNVRAQTTFAPLDSLWQRISSASNWKAARPTMRFAGADLS